MIGRFAPSPTGSLHVGNLRTALAADLSARTQGGELLVRFEDLDRQTSRRAHGDGQLADLAAIGVFPSRDPTWQSERFHLYDAAIDDLVRRDLTFECYCTRREIAESVAAPHGRPALYPGTCRDLGSVERARRRAERPPALRLNSGGFTLEVRDRLRGAAHFPADDVVLRRNDGIASYNLAVVVDDGVQGVTEVVRGDDLLPITASQILLQRLLGHPTPVYLHVPLVLGTDGRRLSKRHGDVTLADLAGSGRTADEVRAMLLASLGQREGEPFDADRVPREPFVFAP